MAAYQVIEDRCYGKIAYNYFVMLLFFILCASMAGISFSTYKTMQMYKEKGIVTSATLLNFYVSPPDGKRKYNLYKVDYSFEVYNVLKNKTDVFIKRLYSVNLKGRYHYTQLNPVWRGFKAGDKFDVIYIHRTPNKHKIIMEDDPRDGWPKTAGFALIFCFFTTLIPSNTKLGWCGRCMFTVSSMLILSGFIGLFYYVIEQEPPISAELQISLFSLGVLLLWLYYYKRSFSAQNTENAEAVITEHKIVTTGGRISYFSHLYTYEYKDDEGNLHKGEKRFFMVSRKIYAPGSKIKIIFKCNKPASHMTAGII